MPRKNALDTDSIRDCLADRGGRQFWRSLDDLAQTDEFRQYLAREFPENASEFSDKTSRRRFLQLMGASLALAGINGCTKQPEEKIIPHVRQAEYRVPGKPWFYASAMTTGGFAKGVLVESHMGRPTKIEGNKLHPASLGATDVFGQASLLTLYDPDRSQTVINGRQVGTWNSFLTDVNPHIARLEANEGAGLRLLTETVTSPTFESQVEKLLEKYPKAKWHRYEPINRDNERAGLRLVFGQDKNPVYDFSRADVVLSLDADFLTTGPANVRYARDFMTRRFARTAEGSAEMNRLYVVESTPSSTGGKADHRRALSPSQIERFAFAVANRLGLDVPESGQTFSEFPDAAVDVLVDDLKNGRRKSDPGGAVVIAGAQQTPAVHALAQAMNSALGAIGTTVRYTDPIEAHPVDHHESLDHLVSDLNTGTIEMLVILDANPVYNAPAASGFLPALAKAQYRVHMGLYRDETARLCDWHIPETHFLETWSDARAFDGTATIIQPLIAPLYKQKSRHELLATLDGHAEAKGYDIVRAYWQEQKGNLEGFDSWWEQCLHDGVVPDTEAETVDGTLRGDLAGELSKLPSSPQTDNLELSIRPDPTIWDGCFANNGWLQELPKPITKLTWDNAALISPALAKEKGLSNGDVVELTRGEQSLRLPVWQTPGQPNDTVTVHLGYGRAQTGQVGKGTGFDAYQLLPRASTFNASDVTVQSTGDTYQLATTQNHHSMEGRHLIRSGTLAQFNANPQHPKFMSEGHHGADKPISFYPDYEYDGYKWGMAINLGGCTGCNACVVACQSENNIPVVGKEEVEMGREMHWIRVDHYYEGDPHAGKPSDLSMHFQPLPCMHCEKAPCEPVCPVAATTHSDEGLNEMTYNRCVGTRYCANNCPYKVRRFNFFEYTKQVQEHETLKMLQNPDVTVRARGVMEKCTYCVQRVSHARIAAEKEQRSIRDGEVVTACQAACPTRAIVFGDLNDPDSEVTRAKHQSLDYVLLEEINTRPRTSYTASVFNPNPKLKTPSEKHEPAP